MRDLFDYPISRNSDPETSHRAEAEHTVTGKRVTRAGQVLKLLYDNPWSTSGELSLYMYKKWPELGFTCCAQTPSKRVSDLEKAGLVSRFGTKVCRDTGRECTAWGLTDKGYEAYDRHGEHIGKEV